MEGDDVGSSVTGDLLGRGDGGTGVGGAFVGRARVGGAAVGDTGVGAHFQLQVGAGNGAGDGGRTGVLVGTTLGSVSTSMGVFVASPVAKFTHKLMPSSYAPLHSPLAMSPIPKTGKDVIRISLPEAWISPSKENFSDLSPFEAIVCATPGGEGGEKSG